MRKKEAHAEKEKYRIPLGVWEHAHRYQDVEWMERRFFFIRIRYCTGESIAHTNWIEEQVLAPIFSPNVIVGPHCSAYSTADSRAAPKVWTVRMDKRGIQDMLWRLRGFISFEGPSTQDFSFFDLLSIESRPAVINIALNELRYWI